MLFHRISSIPIVLFIIFANISIAVTKIVESEFCNLGGFPSGNGKNDDFLIKKNEDQRL